MVRITIPLITLLLAGCLFDITDSGSDAENPEPLNEDPYTIGEIVKINDEDFEGLLRHWSSEKIEAKDGMLEILVDGKGKDPTSESVSRVVWFTLDKETEVFRQNEDNSLVAYDKDHLETGRQVKAWVRGWVYLSNPGMTFAKRIVVIEE